MKPPDKAQLACDHAISVRVFSEHKKDSYYWVANWMYLGTDNDFDRFQNRDDEQSISVHQGDKRQIKFVKDWIHNHYNNIKKRRQ